MDTFPLFGSLGRLTASSIRLLIIMNNHLFRNKEGGYFLKKMWCWVAGDVKHIILDLSTESIR